MMENSIICGDCIDVMKTMPDGCIDLTVTSPPYDNLRDYKGYNFDFEGVAKELYRVTKDGGIVVWVVGDATIKGSETGTSFKQALYFMELGFNLHDTMIYRRQNRPLTHNRYEQHFEYMFVLSKGKPKTFNPIMKDTKIKGFVTMTVRNKDGTEVRKDKKRRDKCIIGNVWDIKAGNNSSTTDSFAFKHPAIFPEQLAHNHIISWSNEGDTVLDPMCGSGTTLKIAKKLGRNYIGIDCSEEYCKIAIARIKGE